MNRRVVVAIGAAGRLALSLSVGVRSLRAQTPTRGTQFHVIKKPDLIVKWVSVGVQEGSLPLGWVLKVCVRNTGDGPSAKAKLAVYHWQSYPPGVWHEYNLDALESGPETSVDLRLTSQEGFAKTLFNVFVDCPVNGKQLGQVREGYRSPKGTTRQVGEMNNVLVCPVDPAFGVPQKIYNPGACCGGF